MSRAFRPFAGTVFVLYLMLVNVAAWCEASHYFPLESEHQHTTPITTHSPLCTWACAVSVASSSCQVSSISLDHPIPLFERLALSPISVVLQPSSDFRSTRAPPYSISILQPLTSLRMP